MADGLALTAFNQTRLFMICFCVSTAMAIVWRFRDQRRFLLTSPALVYGPPPRLLGLWRMPSLSVTAFTWVGLGCVASLLMAAFGPYPRAALAAALLLHLLYFSQITGLSYVQRKPNLLAVCLLILLVAPGIGEPLRSTAAQWPILFVYGALAQMYFSAGWQKLRRSGFRWADGRTLRAHLARHHLSAGTPLAWRLASWPALVTASSVLVLTWELTFPLVVFVPSAAPAYAWVGVAFHVGNLLAMRIDYATYTAPVYTVFMTGWLASVLTSAGW